MAGPKPVICVFCGSSTGKSQAHITAARSLAQTFHVHNIQLVYGGGTTGLMGELAKTLVSLSGPDSVHGVIPDALLAFEAKDKDHTKGQPGKTNGSKLTPDEKVFGRTTTVPNMHTRKKMMCDLVCAGGPGSGFVALSGGYGTLEELMEIVTWNQLGIQDRGVCVFNVEGYWDGILKWVRDSVEAGFVGEGNKNILVEGKTAEECVERLRDYEVAHGRFKLNWEDEGGNKNGES